ncbi:uncharacterized mitochondrial protein-like protein [Tanacetum coccineum]
MASQFEMFDLGELTYYLGIEVSQEKGCVKIKQERYAMKILKEAGIEDCNATLYPMDKDLMFSKTEDGPKVEATQYRKVRSSHNVDNDDGRSTTRHVFYLGTAPITWCSQKQTTVALSLCEVEFMTATTAACQAIRLRELLAEVTGLDRQKRKLRAYPLTKALAFIRFKEMRSLLGVQELPSSTQKFRG